MPINDFGELARRWIDDLIGEGRIRPDMHLRCGLAAVALALLAVAFEIRQLGKTLRPRR